MNNSEIIERMKISAGIKEDQELAKLFDITKSAVANWKRGTAISLSQVVEFSITHNVSLDWLIFGNERQTLNEMEQGLLTRFQALDFEGKLAVLNAANNKSAVGLGGVSQNANGNVGNMVGGNQTGSQRVQIFDLNED